MPVLVDSNVLIDIAYCDPDWMEWSGRQMKARLADGLIINPVIFAEFCFRYDDYDSADGALERQVFRREHLPWEAAFAGARAFRLYRARGGGRDRVLPDFLIGGHAAVRGYDVLTRDPAGYRTYFPTVEVIAPDTHP